MSDFLCYMFFSGLEFLAVFLLIASFFNIKLKYYVKELVIGVLISTLLSYVLVILNVYKLVPLPFILAPCIAVILIKFFQEKKKYSFIVSIGSSALYCLIQIVIGLLAVQFEYITIGNLNNAFYGKVHILQLICFSVGIAISIFVKYSNSSFGFSLRKGKYVGFALSSSIIFIVSVSLAHYQLINRNWIQLPVIALIFVISVTLFMYMFYQRDKYEFSYTK